MTDTKSQQVTAVCRFTAGALIRGQIKRQIKNYCFDAGISCSIQEDRGLLNSELYITFKGDRELIVQAKRDIESWFKELQ